MRPSHSVLLVLIPIASLLPVAIAAGEPIVWSGPSITFSKAPFEDPPPIDQLTSNVGFTRGSSAGLYNATQESFFSSTSPADTLWATSLNNPGETISATNWSALDFTTWTNAYGGPGSLATEITAQNAVVHLITDDIYLDLQFTEWGMMPGSGTPFTYERSTPSAPPPITGDHNGDGIVDAADYVLWRKIDIDGQQGYDDWRTNFGTSSGSSLAATVPEPSPLIPALALFGITRLARISRHTGTNSTQ